MEEISSPEESPVGSPAIMTSSAVESPIKFKRSKITNLSGCLLDKLDINVTDTEKRYNTGTVNIRDAYTVYLIETKVKGNASDGELLPASVIWRRYSEFEALREHLQEDYPYVVVPPLPEKKISFPWDSAEDDILHSDFVDRRKAGLENFLLRVATHSVLSQDIHFKKFIQQDDSCKLAKSTSGYLKKADAKLKTLSVSLMLKKPDKRFEEFKNYSGELYNNISYLLKIHNKMIGRQFGLFKLHKNYSRVFTEWNKIENHMGEGLQQIPSLMDSYSDLCSCLEEEELFVDQMKEYLSYADALRNVCQQQEKLQYEVEQAEENVVAKHSQREKLLQGKTSFVFRWLINVDTDEVREMKLQQIDEQIQEAENHRRQTIDDANEFMKKAVVEIEEFNEQKIKDLKETLILYSIIQVKICKKALASWINLRQAFENM
ncbi:intercellular trafficking and secretion [Chamberlinius hualienensis]